MRSNKFIYILFTAFLAGTFNPLQAQVKVTDGAVLTMDPNSLLELESTNKGLLIPRIAINNLILPAPLTAPVPEGMIVYSFGGTVVNGFYYWSGTAWMPFATGIGSQWTTNGTNIYYNTGNVGIGTTTPTALLHLKAGTATASTAPLKFTSGPLLSTPEAGAIEFLSDKYYGTITTGGARKTFAFLESPTFTTPDIGAAIGTSLSTTGNITAPVLVSTVTTGSAPFTVTSTTPVANLNIGGTASNVTGIVAIANGGTSASTKVGAFDALSPMSAQGDIIYGGVGGTGISLSKGTAGQVLAMNAGATAPQWQNAGAGAGDMILASVQTASGAKTWSALGTFNLGLNASGADVNINASSNFATNINTGNSTGTVTIGSSSASQTVNIGTGTAAATVNIATGNTASKVKIGSAGTPFSSIIFGTVTTTALGIPDHTNTPQTYTINGATINAAVVVNPAAAITYSGIFMLYARVSAANTVEIGWFQVQCNCTATLAAGQTLNIMVINK